MPYNRGLPRDYCNMELEADMPKKNEPKGQAKWTGSYRTRQEARGLKQIQIWIPVDDEEAIRKYIERKRKAHAKRDVYEGNDLS